MLPQDFLIIAQWGASSYAPANTMAAFDLALARSRSYNAPVFLSLLSAHVIIG
jgi:hypothetical protein